MLLRCSGTPDDVRHAACRTGVAAASFLLCLLLGAFFPAWVWAISALAVVGLLLDTMLGLRVVRRT